MARRRTKVADLAPTLEIDRSTLSRKLNGHVSFTADELLAIATELDVAPATLLGGAA